MTIIIAEAGVNHNGSVETAFRLVDAAKDSGADAVKFQMFDAVKLGRPDIASLQLGAADMERIATHCEKMGIEFMCTPFDVVAVSDLIPLVKRFKIASGCLHHFDLLTAVHHTGLPVLLSTGMSDLHRIWQAINALNADITLLHCTSAYPCPADQVNLAAMDTLRNVFHRHISGVGYSDHTQGISVSLAAVARGATVIEKHLTLDRLQDGPDHLSSVEPDEFADMVDDIREVEKAIGSGDKKLLQSEETTWAVWRDKR